MPPSDMALHGLVGIPRREHDEGLVGIPRKEHQEGLVGRRTYKACKTLSRMISFSP